MNPLRAIEGLPVVKTVGIRVLKLHQEVYVRSGGRIGHRLAGTTNLILRTTGAKSGVERVTALSYVRDGDSVVVIASMGGAPTSPGWFFNLRKNPDVDVQIGTRRRPMIARILASDDPDRARLWALADRHNSGRYTQYQKLTDRVIPVVVLSPR